MYPDACAPQHNDQTAHPPTVTSISGLAHDRDDLVDRGRIGGVPAAFVRWDPAGVMAGHCRRGPGTAGGVQQLMSRHGSLLWGADRLLPALTEPGQKRASHINRRCRVGYCRIPVRLRKRRNQPYSSSHSEASTRHRQWSGSRLVRGRAGLTVGAEREVRVSDVGLGGADRRHWAGQVGVADVGRRYRELAYRDRGWALWLVSSVPFRQLIPAGLRSPANRADSYGRLRSAPGWRGRLPRLASCPRSGPEEGVPGNV